MSSDYRIDTRTATLEQLATAQAILDKRLAALSGNPEPEPLSDAEESELRVCAATGCDPEALRRMKDEVQNGWQRRRG
jgi:hypothetical protein